MQQHSYQSRRCPDFYANYANDNRCSPDAEAESSRETIGSTRIAAGGEIVNNFYYSQKSDQNIICNTCESREDEQLINWSQNTCCNLAAAQQYPTAYPCQPYQHSQHSTVTKRRAKNLLKADIKKILGHLSRFEAILSLVFLIYGLVRFNYETAKAYTNMCATSVVAGLSGLLTGILGSAAVCKSRWKCLMVAYLVMSILSAVAYLLLLISSSVWLGESQKLIENTTTNPNAIAQTRANAFIYLNIIVLLVSVAIGVCFILSSAFICHLWKPNKSRVRRNYTKSYQFIGIFQSAAAFPQHHKLPSYNLLKMPL